MKKNDLKTIIKECIREVLSETTMRFSKLKTGDKFSLVGSFKKYVKVSPDHYSEQGKNQKVKINKNSEVLPAGTGR
jgi:hypothetical protein